MRGRQHDPRGSWRASTLKGLVAIRPGRACGSACRLDACRLDAFGFGTTSGSTAATGACCTGLQAEA